MTDALRMERPRTNARGEDLGDVLASIRRLIAQEAGPGAQAEMRPVAAQTAPTAHEPPSSPARTTAITSSLAEAVEAATARIADASRRVEDDRATAEPPFRLNPDALIPAARPALRLSVLDGGADPAHAEARQPVASDMPPVPVEAAQPVAAARVPFAQAPAPEPPVHEPVAPRANEPWIRATAPESPRTDGTTSPTSAIFTKEQPMDAHPLRNLLRDAIREELRGEFASRMDSDLRRMVREELTAALNEAFGKTAI